MAENKEENKEEDKQMGVNINQICIVAGLLTLAHAAYSAAQHRSYLRLTEQAFTGLPADILLQCLLALTVTCWGITRVTAAFRQINTANDMESKTWETLSNRPSFYTFRHRGTVLFNDRAEG